VIRTIAAGTAFVCFLVALVALLAMDGTLESTAPAILVGLMALSVAVVPDPRRA